MSTQQVSTRAKETLKVLKEMLEKAEEGVQKEVSKAAPKVAKSLDTSVDAAAKGFQSMMKTIDTRTEKEQLGLLTAYRKFLTGQMDYIDSRLAELRKEKDPAQKTQ